MTHFFAFIPSEPLMKDIKFAQANRHSQDPLYPLRDKIALQLNDEILDQVLLQVLHQFPKNEKTETADKLVGYIRSTVQVLLRQLLSKADNKTVLQSLDFIERSLFTDPQGQIRVGAPLDATTTEQLKGSYRALMAGESAKDLRPILAEQYKTFSDQLIKHFMIDFPKTLDLGMIKRKAADIAAAAVTKAVHIAIDRLIPHLSVDELKVLIKHHDQIIF